MNINVFRPPVSRHTTTSPPQTITFIFTAKKLMVRTSLKLVINGVGADGGETLTAAAEEVVLCCSKTPMYQAVNNHLLICRYHLFPQSTIDLSIIN